MNLTKKLGFLFAFSLPLIIVISYFLPNGPYTFAGFLFAYIGVPFLDFLMGKDYNNVIKEDFEELIASKYFDFLVYSHVYIQYSLIFGVSYILVNHNLTLWQVMGLILSSGVYAGTIINVAHELGHRKSKMAQFHSKIALMSVFYLHFFIEHNKGHHVHVATPLDPASSRKNQSLYAFFLQTIPGSFKSAYAIEKDRLRKNNDSNIFKNDVLTGVLASILLFLAIYLIIALISNSFNSISLLYLALQALMAILSLETVNYIEHYGIERKLLSNGKYERVNPLHSWNANHLFSNLVLFNLQRHSDHHAFAARPYQVLRHFEISPQLPFGYPIMMLMSTIPPLWFKVMNHKLEKWHKLAFDQNNVKKVVSAFA